MESTSLYSIGGFCNSAQCCERKHSSRECIPHAGRRIRCLPYSRRLAYVYGGHVIFPCRCRGLDHVQRHPAGLASGKELKDNVYRCRWQVQSAVKSPDKPDGCFCTGSPGPELILQHPDVGRFILPQSKYVDASIYSSCNHNQV